MEVECEKCGNPGGTAYFHPCPFMQDVNDTHDDVCNCCSSCCTECLVDV